MQYRKKPVVVEAFRYVGELKDSEGRYIVPDWAAESCEDGIIYYDERDGKQELYVSTLEGFHHASVGDYIIKGVKGELYPCKPDVFQKNI